MLQVASVGEKHWRGFQSYLNDNGSLQNGEGDDDRQRSTDDDGWGGWDTKGDEDIDNKDPTDNGWDDAEWNSTTWNTPKSKLKPKANKSFTKKEDTSSNGWDNVNMDGKDTTDNGWDDGEWNSSTWNTPKSKLKPKATSTKKEDTSSNGWDNVDMDQWNDADWTPSKQRGKAD